MNKKYILSAFATALLCVPVVYLATDVPIVYSQTSSCVDLTANISLGSSDARTKNEVTKVQGFLYAQKYLTVGPTGYFGALSQAAIRKFQVSNGIAVTGTVGPLTRAKIKQISCASTGIQSLPVNSTASVLTKPVSQGASTNTLTLSALQITSLTPNQGRGGETITVIGSGFTSDTVVNYKSSTSTTSGLGQIGGKNLTIVSTNELRFYLDSRHVGNSYSGNQFFYLSNSKGSSNFLNFTFIGGIDKVATGTTQATMNIGSVGVDVITLQNFLERKGFLTIPQGVAKGTFDQNTKDAIAKYQTTKGIYPADGVFGALTRAAIAAESSSGESSIQPSAPMTVTVPGPGMIYKDTDSVLVRWTPYTGNFDKYYVMLGNKVTGSSINPAPDITISKYATQFTLPLADAYRGMVVNRGNHSVEELQNSYYI